MSTDESDSSSSWHVTASIAASMDHSTTVFLCVFLLALETFPGRKAKEKLNTKNHGHQ